MSNRRTGDIVKRGYETNSHRKAKYKSWKTVGILENEICVCGHRCNKNNTWVGVVTGQGSDAGGEV